MAAEEVSDRVTNTDHFPASIIAAHKDTAFPSILGSEGFCERYKQTCSVSTDLDAFDQPTMTTNLPIAHLAVPNPKVLDSYIEKIFNFIEARNMTLTCVDPTYMIAGYQLDYQMPSKRSSLTLRDSPQMIAGDCPSAMRELVFNGGSGILSTVETLLRGVVMEYLHNGGKLPSKVGVKYSCLPNLCEGVQCENCGIHVLSVDSCICDCPPGFTGLRCEIEKNLTINNCDPSPCKNNSTCVNEGTSSMCVCQDGFEGDLCEVDINDCEGVVCEDGGNCIDLVNGYRCQSSPVELFDKALLSRRKMSDFPSCTVTGNTMYDTGGASGTYSSGEDYRCTIACPSSQVVTGYNLDYNLGTGSGGKAYVETKSGDKVVYVKRGTGSVTSTVVFADKLYIHVYSRSGSTPTGTGFELDFICDINPCPDITCSGNKVVSYNNNQCGCECPETFTGNDCEVSKHPACTNSVI